MSLFSHSAKNFWIFLKKILCRVPRQSLPSALPMALSKDPENCNFFYIPLQQTSIYIYINYHIYIANMHYISQAHAYLINPSQMHQSSTSQVYYYKFNITKFNVPTAATETTGVAPWTAVKDRTAAKGWRDQPPVTLSLNACCKNSSTLTINSKS